MEKDRKVCGGAFIFAHSLIDTFQLVDDNFFIHRNYKIRTTEIESVSFLSIVFFFFKNTEFTKKKNYGSIKGFIFCGTKSSVSMDTKDLVLQKIN